MMVGDSREKDVRPTHAVETAAVLVDRMGTHLGLHVARLDALDLR